MKACVLGCSVSGKAACKLLIKVGYDVYGIDKKNIKEFPCPVYNEDIDLKRVDLLVVSSGIRKDHPLVKKANQLKIEVIGEIELGLRYLKNPCIAVTGTNGKSTTTKLIGHILNSCGIDAICLGNIGIPLCEKVLELKDQIVVLELSSYQIEWINQKKIDRAVVLNITEDHLDRYEDFAEYANAKLRLNTWVKEKVWVNKNILNQNLSFSKENIIFFNQEQMVATLNKLGYICTVGESNENVFAAWQMVKSFVKEKDFIQAAKTFSGLEHRFERLGMVNGSEVFNDSKATNPASTLFALTKIPKKAVVLLGGEDKGLSFLKLREKKDQISSVICFGKTGKKIAEELSLFNPQVFPSLEKAAFAAFEKANKENCILFSPGCASFDAFKNYRERGSFFKQLFIEYKKGKSL